MSLSRASALMLQRLTRGVEAAVMTGARAYESEVSARAYPPASDVGQYPHVRSGQGSEGVRWATRSEQGFPEGKTGLYGDDSPVGIYPGKDPQQPGSWHLAALSELQQRRGLPDVYQTDYTDDIRRAFVEAACQ